MPCNRKTNKGFPSLSLFFYPSPIPHPSLSMTHLTLLMTPLNFLCSFVHHGKAFFIKGLSESSILCEECVPLAGLRRHDLEF